MSETPEGAWLLHGYTAAMNDVLLDAWGNRDFERTATEILGSMHDQRYVRKPRLVAVADDEHDAPDPDRVLGYAMVNLPLQDNTHTAHVEIGVRPAHAPSGRRGVALRRRPHAGPRGRPDAPSRRPRDQRVEPPEGPGTLAATTGVGRVDGRRRRSAVPAASEASRWSRSSATRCSTCPSTRTSSRSTAPRPRRTPDPTTAW